MKILIVIASLILAGCTSQHLGESPGPVFPLNAGQWTPTPADMAVGDPQ